MGAWHYRPDFSARRSTKLSTLSLFFGGLVYYVWYYSIVTYPLKYFVNQNLCSLGVICSEFRAETSLLAITLNPATTYFKPMALRPLYNLPKLHWMWTIFFKILTPRKMHDFIVFFHLKKSCTWTTCPIGIVDVSYESWHAWLNFLTRKLGWVNSRGSQSWKNSARAIKIVTNRHGREFFEYFLGACFHVGSILNWTLIHVCLLDILQADAM